MKPSATMTAGGPRHPMAMALLLAAVFLVPGVVFAEPQVEETIDTVCDFLGSIKTSLDIGSIAVVAVTILIVGQQIAFAHKRAFEVAPILIGGLLIGAAVQIANMMIDKPICSASPLALQADQRR